MKEIENAFCQGLLKDFIAQRVDHRQENIKKGEGEYRHQKVGQQPNAIENKVINIISTNSGKYAGKKQDHEEDDAPLVVTLDISRCTIKRILLDMKSAGNVIFKDAFDQMGIPPEEIEPRTTSLADSLAEASARSIVLPCP